MRPRPAAIVHLIGAALPVLSFGGCEQRTTTPAPPKPLAAVATHAEAAWEEQVASVRADESDTIRSAASPVSSGQWAMLEEGCESLRILEADVRLLTPADLQRLSHFTQLERLKLTGPVDGGTVRIVAALSGLKVLNLPHGTFANDDLASLQQLSRLELLRIGSPHVTDDGMQSVSQMDSLRFLHLIDVPITDAGLKPLHGMTQLESFYLDGGHCTEEGLYELLESLPELHFHRDQLHLPNDPQADHHEKSE